MALLRLGIFDPLFLSRYFSSYFSSLGNLGHASSRSFAAILTATLTAVSHSASIQSTADDVIANAGQVFYPPAADENH